MKRVGKRIFAGIRLTPNSSKGSVKFVGYVIAVQSVYDFPATVSRVFHAEARHPAFVRLYAGCITSKHDHIKVSRRCSPPYNSCPYNAHLRTLLSILIRGKWRAYIQREDVILLSKMYVARYRTLFNKVTPFYESS